ncbi:MAG: PQQ-binding-like beta-propeller repeat protein, partial [Solirubrobacterales bacterium]
MHSNNGRTSNAFITVAALALIVFSAIVLSACTTATPADTWELPNQNIENTRYIGGRISTSTIENVAVGWTADVKTAAGVGTDAPSPFIDANDVFVSARSGGTVALDLFTGQPSAAATIAANLNQRPKFIDRLKPKAFAKLAANISPISTTGKDDAEIVVGAGDGTVQALNLSDSSQAWSRTLEAEGDTTPHVVSNMAAAKEQIFVPVVNLPKGDDAASAMTKLETLGKASGQLVSINPENGKVNWTKKLASVPLGAATVVNDIVFTSTLDGHVYGFNTDGGDEVWSSELPAGAVAPIAAYDDTLVVPASLVTEPGQKAQVVAFKIGGLGEVGGAAAPKIQKQTAQKRAAATKPETTGAPAAAGPDGKALFVANCAGCHTLSAAGTSGTVGPNLDDLKPNEAVVEKQVINGGGGMPPFKG